jgi:hypothetical protein
MDRVFSVPAARASDVLSAEQIVMLPTIPRPPRYILFLAIIFLLTPGAVILARWPGRVTAPAQPVTPATLQRADRLEIELITLRPYGFEPAEISRPKGQFVLFVEDQSGRNDASLRLQKLDGGQVRDVNTSRMKSEWHDVINLPSGEYVLTDASNPESRCQITILP